ncbi:MAG: ABC transporter ATP-binding protein [Chloroflexi bacterium]|uniref:ABC transporter ATP-binding protein n=1 Tax=Candidatus Flexifilum breve TaxID=3140694 RepID=UPI0031350194|nr:ABC transporter ATP-binding protein [Chloroflexota bacterium]MBK9749352.1 ABC transporter ATP-binding protein [Chloroflexota bacterium]
MREQPQTSMVLEELTKKFTAREGSGEVIAVDSVSLTIQKGEFVTLLGPSGCGKTTTLRLIAGFEMPSSGRLLLEGQDITNQAPNKRDMALVFQSYALFPHMSVFDNVAYGLHLRKLSRDDIQKRVNATLEMIGLGQLGKRRPNQLSGGQQQRVALARALVMEPRVLLFDEPLSNLDAKMRVQMRSEIHRLQRRLNITTIYVTHDQIEAMSMSDRIVVMNAGRIEQIGTPEDIYRCPQTHFVADFIGRANFVQATVADKGSASTTLTLLGLTLTLPSTVPVPVGSQVEVLLRPEAIKLRADAALPQATVEQTMYLGSEIEYVVLAKGIRLTVAENDPRVSQIFAEGETVGIDFVAEAIHIIPA